MSHWDYDTVFYRVFCLTLLAVAFTFTAILTDVFVDLDGLLATKEKVKAPKPPPTTINHDLSELSRAINIQIPEDKSEAIYEDKDYQDSNDLYRNKRSLVSDKDRIFQIQDPKVKKLLTEHLANLLDELDEQDNKKITTNKHNNRLELENMKTNNDNQYANIDVNKHKNKEKEVKDKKDVVSIKENFKENKLSIRNDNTDKSHEDYKAELLHLAMHNAILQGIIENTDLDVVYKKVADLVMDFEKDHSKLNKDELGNLFKNVKIFEKRTDSDEGTSSDEFKNFKKMVQKKQFSYKKNTKVTTDNNVVQKTFTSNPKDRDVIIKTIIDITAMTNDKPNKDSELKFKDKINGIIKVIYNGNIIKFKRTNDDKKTNSQSIQNKMLVQKEVGNMSPNNNMIGETHENQIHASNQNFYQKIFYDYLKKLNGTDSLEQEKVFSSKRLKRHVKIRFENKKITAKPKTKKDDEKVFVEIETHFDTKGAKGDKKKKLIKDLIQKIQNAIHSDHDVHVHKKKQKHWNVKKRVQDPLNSKSATTLINKLIIPLETLAHRHLDPISKIVPVHEDMPLVTNNFDRNHWGRTFMSDKPRFFGKAINSAELNMVDIDYNKVMRKNGIPQRLQKPINTDISDEVFEDSKIVDIGNIKFLMKDIDGTGFSIGFNQYTDQAPDPETMKLFSGLENVIQTYHQQYDQETNSDARQENPFDNAMNNLHDEVDFEEQADNSEQHKIQRRSILTSKENDYHPNHYRIVYGHNSLPYKDYNDIFGKNKLTISKIKNMKIYKMKTAENSAFIIDENIFDKNLKPSEILTIADLLQRKKRSIKVKKISNVKIKSNMNKYLNTKKMAMKALLKNKNHNKRTKRQINKIRIIARDLPEQGKSEEDNVFLVSDEKIFADRALLKEVEVPEMEPIDKVQSDEHYDITLPQEEEEVSQTQGANENPENNFDVFDPYCTDNLNPSDEFSRRARHNSLMSKYPHIISNEVPKFARTNHDDIELVDVQQQYSNEPTTAAVIPALIDVSSPNVQDLADLLKPPKDLNNYRLSVKIRPKNATNMSGYKEVHTSINKSYNKNGLIYTSLVNVSQLSKVEKLNKSISRRGNNEHIREHKVDQEGLKQQQDLIKSLIQQHKHRLDMQLKHLQTEKQKLEAIDRDNFEDNNRPTNMKKIRKSLQDEAKKKLIRETTTVDTKTETTTIEPTTTATSTTQRVKTTTEDAIKAKMIETIQRNENVTSELLKKIDQNTGVLKIFLGKLISTMASKTESIENKGRPNINNESSSNNPTLGTKQPTNDLKENSHAAFNFEDYHLIPNMLLRNMPRATNNSYGIPFVYAVQRPFGAIPNRDNMASVVYHGHIHTNAMNANIKRDKKSPAKIVLKDKVKIVPDKKINDFWKPKPGETVIQDFVVKNNTRFFLDESLRYKNSSDQAKNLFSINMVNTTKV